MKREIIKKIVDPPSFKPALFPTLQHYRISHFAFDDEYTNTILRVITIEKKQVRKIQQKLQSCKEIFPYYILFSLANPFIVGA